MDKSSYVKALARPSRRAALYTRGRRDSERPSPERRDRDTGEAEDEVQAGDQGQAEEPEPEQQVNLSKNSKGSEL